MSTTRVTSDAAIEGGDLRWPRRLGMDRLVWLDCAIPIPGPRVRVRLDPNVGLLVPGGRDALRGLLSLTLVFLAMQQRVSVWTTFNIAMDAAIGGILVLPLLLLMAALTCALQARRGGPR